MPYPKRYMKISELCKTGMSRYDLKRYVHIPGFPAQQHSNKKNSPWKIDTDALDEWLKRYGGRV